MEKAQELRFTNFLRDKADEAERAIKYKATYFRGMLANHGGYATAVRLLSDPGLSDGFTTLWENGRLDLSVEALVVETEWRTAFEPVLLAQAERKLAAVGYQFRRYSA